MSENVGRSPVHIATPTPQYVEIVLIRRRHDQHVEVQVARRHRVVAALVAELGQLVEALHHLDLEIKLLLQIVDKRLRIAHGLHRLHHLVVGHELHDQRTLVLQVLQLGHHLRAAAFQRLQADKVSGERRFCLVCLQANIFDSKRKEF